MSKRVQTGLLLVMAHFQIVFRVVRHAQVLWKLLRLCVSVCLCLCLGMLSMYVCVNVYVSVSVPVFSLGQVFTNDQTEECVRLTSLYMFAKKVRALLHTYHYQQLFLHEFSVAYNKYAGETLQPQAYGYGSVEELLSAIPQVREGSGRRGPLPPQIVAECAKIMMGHQVKAFRVLGVG